MSFVTYNNVTGELQIYSDDNSSAGSYDLKVYLPGYSSYYIEFYLYVYEFDLCREQDLIIPEVDDYNYTVHDSHYVVSFSPLSSNLSYCLDFFDYYVAL
jgi:hypothetical protein